MRFSVDYTQQIKRKNIEQKKNIPVGGFIQDGMMHRGTRVVPRHSVGNQCVPKEQRIKATTGDDGPTGQQGRKHITHDTT